MIERSPIFDFVTYARHGARRLLVVLLPFWIIVVAGSQSLQEVSQVPISLLALDPSVGEPRRRPGRAPISGRRCSTA